MLTTIEILSTLDNCYDLDNWNFITLNHPYVYLIDSRINIFRDKLDHWAVAAEVLGFNPRGGGITLEVFYFGNCLTNLDLYNNKPINTFTNYLFDDNNFQSSVDFDVIKPNADFWIARNTHIPLSHNKRDYDKAGIKLLEYEPNQIRIEEAARLCILNYGHLFRATDDELYKSIPRSLEKILVIDEWYHKEFVMIKHTFVDTEILNGLNLDQESIKNIISNQTEQNIKTNLDEWDNNRPSSYETWQQLADVITSHDISQYKPTFAPTSHWKNWPESGAL